jgi:GNAT superfamily N-acetyltransferase
MTIRLARLDDAAAIAELSGQLGYPATAEQAAERLAKILPRADGAVFVADADGIVAGWTHVIGCERLEDGGFAEIGGLVVRDGYRGRGVGVQLMAAAERWAAERGYPRMVVRSNVIRERAHRFYERLEYKATKRQAVFVKRLE